MGIINELESTVEEAFRHLQRDSAATVGGRSFFPIVGTLSREKPIATAGFVDSFDAQFCGLNSDLLGLSLSSTVGQILTHDGKTYLVNRIERGPHFTTFFLKAKNA